MCVFQPRRRQNRIVLKDGTTRNAHAQGAGHYHWLERTPRRGRSQWRGEATLFAWVLLADAGTARVLARSRKALISSALVVFCQPFEIKFRRVSFPLC